MPVYQTSVPAPIFRGASEPNAADYYGWVDTDNGDFYTSDGTTWTKVNTSVGQFNEIVLENALDILEIQAADTLEGGQSTQMLRDVYSDTTGYLDTIDTGSTTATFSTNKYTNIGSIVEAHNLGMTTGGSGTTKYGMKFTVGGSAINIVSLTKNSNDNSTKGYILDSGASVVATADFVGNVATFSTPYSASASTTYYCVGDGDGASIQHAEQSGKTYPVAGTTLSWISGFTGGSDNATWSACVESMVVETGAVNSIVQTDAQTIAAGATNFQVFAWKPETAGTGEIDCDISFNGGTNYQTAVALDTPTVITNTGTSIILKLNLNAGASAGTASAKGYGVLYW